MVHSSKCLQSACDVVVLDFDRSVQINYMPKTLPSQLCVFWKRVSLLSFFNLLDI